MAVAVEVEEEEVMRNTLTIEKMMSGVVKITITAGGRAKRRRGFMTEVFAAAAALSRYRLDTRNISRL